MILIQVQVSLLFAKVTFQKNLSFLLLKVCWDRELNIVNWTINTFDKKVFNIYRKKLDRLLIMAKKFLMILMGLLSRKLHTNFPFQTKPMKVFWRILKYGNNSNRINWGILVDHKMALGPVPAPFCICHSYLPFTSSCDFKMKNSTRIYHKQLRNFL